MKKQWISVKCGLSRDPKHRRRMGKSVWTFLHMLDLADWETGIVYDWKDENAAENLGVDIRVLREDRRRLEKEDYISCRQKQYGQDITIMNWTNPREYSGITYNKKQGYENTPPSKSPQGYAQGSRKNVTPTFKSNIKYIQDLIRKEIEMKSDLSVWDVAEGVFDTCKEKGMPISGKQKVIIREWLLTIESSNEDTPPAKTQPKKKEDKVNTDIKTVARSRGVSEETIKFVDRACKAFGFSMMQLDEVSLVAYRWIMDQEAKGQTIEQFADWARLDEQGKFIGKYRNNGGNIKNDWARAFGIKPPDDRTSLIRRMT